MATLVLPSSPPSPEEDRPSDNGGNGMGGRPFDNRGYGPHENSEPNPNRWATPLSAYRTAALVGVVWILTLFVTLTCILEFLRVHSKNWVLIPLPHVLYMSTAVLMLSSLTIEFARFTLRAEASKRCTRWLFVTLLLGITFIGGQIAAWRDFASHGLYLASTPGEFFFYLITAAHCVLLLGGIIALTHVVFLIGRLPQRGKQHTAVSVISLYWHFMDGLWLYLVGLLFVTIQH